MRNILSRFIVNDLPFNGLKLIKRSRINDARGFLVRMFCDEDLENQIGWSSQIRQINHTKTTEIGTVRGMHYQLPPYAETKIVTCIKGEIIDIAIDLRADSSTFLKYHSEILSDQNDLSLIIPEGFAHGFQALSDDVELIYFHTERYNRDFEAAINPLDPAIMIDWPKEITNISQRDKNHPFLDKEYRGVLI